MLCMVIHVCLIHIFRRYKACFKISISNVMGQGTVYNTFLLHCGAGRSCLLQQRGYRTARIFLQPVILGDQYNVAWVSDIKMEM